MILHHVRQRQSSKRQDLIAKRNFQCFHGRLNFSRKMCPQFPTRYANVKSFFKREQTHERRGRNFTRSSEMKWLVTPSLSTKSCQFKLSIIFHCTLVQLYSSLVQSRYLKTYQVKATRLDRVALHVALLRLTTFNLYSRCNQRFVRSEWDSVSRGKRQLKWDPPLCGTRSRTISFE